MKSTDSDVPLPLSGLAIGVLYNLKKGLQGRTEDCEAEYDSIETVHAIQAALTQGGAQVYLMEAAPDLPDKLLQTPIDLAFNIAEGFHGRGREAQIPALLNMLGIPFTGSDETTLCLALDKALTKRLLATYHIRTPRYALLEPEDARRLPPLRYPVIVKPNAEGSSKGISGASVVQSPQELRVLFRKNLALYGEAMLAEEYIEGREFTIGLLGNGRELRVFAPMEICYKQPTQGDFHVYDYTVKQDYQRYVSYACPAALEAVQEQAMAKMARRAFEALGCRDFARADFRMAADGKIYFIEINPLPGLAPGYGDYPMLAAFCGVPYDTLVQSVALAAVRRCRLMPAREAM